MDLHTHNCSPTFAPPYVSLLKLYSTVLSKDSHSADQRLYIARSRSLSAEFKAYLKKVITIIKCIDARLKVNLRYLRNLK